MLQYLLKRLLIFIPTIIVISLLMFILSANAPGDPVELMLNKNSGNDGQSSQKLSTEKAYNELRHKLGFDLPLFYFSFSNSTSSDTLHKIPKKAHRENLERLASNYGNWSNVAAYYNTLRDYENSVFAIASNDSSAIALNGIKERINDLYKTYEEAKVAIYFSDIEKIYSSAPDLAVSAASFQKTKDAYATMQKNQNTYAKYIPAIHIYGFENQYHRWLFGTSPWFFGEEKPGDNYGFLRKDFGISYQDKRPVWSVLKDALRWTVMLSTISIFLAYILAIPIGVMSAIKKGTLQERATTTTLFILYSLPSFWIATILIIYFCGGDYLDWFPAFGLGTLPPDAPFTDRFMETAYHLILPIFCLSYGSLAYISRQMRGGMLNVIGQDYIRTARAKGLEDKKVVWKHAFRNSLLPILTLFANIFPAAISGSFVIEFIFSIPGMGMTTLQAINARNYPIVFTAVMFTAILTLIGTLVADMLYAAVDPRISYSNKK
ncbi:MAG: hypothetical protein POELPBGB_03633 [Bacteroidia bacterium]|nr:hypothetical protein [Bacteroidia bacterium]